LNEFVRWPSALTSSSTTITTIDAHAAGEPLRIITGGLPELPGATILERRRYMEQHLDHVRRALMWEPRGHFDMYGCVVTPPVTEGAHAGVIFMHNAGYSTMCGHGVIALVTALIETGAFPRAGERTPVTLDTPAGLVRAQAWLDADGRVERVSFINVPSFVYAQDLEIDMPQFGKVRTDVAFGGAYYAILPARNVGLNVDKESARELKLAGTAVTGAVNRALRIEDPNHEDLAFLYGTIFTGPPEDRAHHSRNICIFADAEVDRSPTGTGVSARVALHDAKGELPEGSEIAIESVLGRDSVFTGRVHARTTVGKFSAVVPEVSGRAFLTGTHTFVLDPRDHLGGGFLV
jgi:trans-L-3-hydroxyproline dehydratase